MTFSAIALALAPILLVIFFGWLARVTGLIADSHMVGVERLTYVVLFPVLLFSSLSTADIAAPGTGALVATLVGTQALACLAMWPLSLAVARDGPAATSVFQGAVRFNTYVIFALVVAFVGPEAVAIVAVPLAFNIILVNVFCVSILARHGNPPEGAARPSLWRGLATNPLIVSCVAGLAVNFLSPVWPLPIVQIFDWSASAAVLLGLFAVGAGLCPVAGLRDVAAVAVAFAVRQIAIPAVVLAGLVVLTVPADLALLALIATIVPTATSSYVLARQLGGDAPLIAQITTIGTVASFATIPVWLGIFAVAFPA